MPRFESNEAKLAHAKQLLQDGLRDVGADPDALAAYLRFRAHFRDFSSRNTLLIHAQRPGARYCRGFSQWQDVGRRVAKGEKGLLIWVPRFKKATAEDARERSDVEEGDKVHVGFIAGYVWDYSQTVELDDFDGDPLRYVSPIPVLTSDDRADLTERFEEALTARGYTVAADPATIGQGYLRYSRRIVGYRADLAPDHVAKTLAHELAHALAHRGTEASEAAREIQAEGAAFLACHALGLDTSSYSLPYLNAYTDEQEGETLRSHLDAIESIAWQMLDLVDETSPAVSEPVAVYAG